MDIRQDEYPYMKPTRKMKIHAKFRTRRWDNITVPEIRLQGKWLEEAGFKQGEYVKIQVEHNKLTITVDHAQSHINT